MWCVTPEGKFWGAYCSVNYALRPVWHVWFPSYTLCTASNTSSIPAEPSSGERTHLLPQSLKSQFDLHLSQPSSRTATLFSHTTHHTPQLESLAQKPGKNAIQPLWYLGHGQQCQLGGLHDCTGWVLTTCFHWFDPSIICDLICFLHSLLNRLPWMKCIACCSEEKKKKEWLWFCGSAIYGMHGNSMCQSVFKHFSAISGISCYLRKIAQKLKQRKVIEQQGDLYIIKTISTFRNYVFSFKVGQEFEEFTQGLDNRHVKVRAKKYEK